MFQVPATRRGLAVSLKSIKSGNRHLLGDVNFLSYTWGSSVRACCSALTKSSSTLELAQMDRQAWLLARCTPSVMREYRVLELQLQDRVFE